MITYHEKTDNFSMHPLVHTWVRERPQNKIAEQAIWCEAAITTLAQCILIPPLGISEADEEMKRDLLPHVDRAQTYQSEIALKIAARQAKRKSIIPVAPPVLGRQRIFQAVKFSLVYAQSGKWEEAERLQLMVKNYVCSRLGVAHPLSMRIMLALSGIYWQQTRAKEAAELQSQVLQACIDSLGATHPKTLKAMDTLGATRCLQGRFKESHELHEKAIEGMTKILGPKHENTLLAMNNFGRIKWMYFQYEEAKNWYLKAVAGMKEVFGEHHLETLVAIENLSMTYVDLGGHYLQVAHDDMEEVLKARKEKLGKEAPWTLLAICNLARVKSALGNTTEAEEMMCAAIPIAERDLGEDHFGTLAGKVHYAQVLVRLKRYDEAEEIFTKVIERQRYASAARDDGEHPDRILAMDYLMQCYQEHGKIEKAIEICEELAVVVQTIGGQGLGKQHVFAKKLDRKREELLELRGLAASSACRSG
jgi:tetratricopeptide (TPR) repeat protein